MDTGCNLLHPFKITGSKSRSNRVAGPPPFISMLPQPNPELCSSSELEAACASGVPIEAFPRLGLAIDVLYRSAVAMNNINFNALLGISATTL